MNTIALSTDPLALADLVPPATLEEARAFRNDLARLLHRERVAAADFLVALSDFDRRRGWEQLGHASLFSFLTRELGLSKGAAYVRLAASRLLPRFPEVEAALREGNLCLSAAGELARVLSEENRLEVLPRFFGCSSREAREVAAALAPRGDVPRRDAVTAVVRMASPMALVRTEAAAPPLRASAPPAPARAGEPTRPEVRAHEPLPIVPARAQPRDEAEPLDADLRRLHVTVTRRLLEKIDRARAGLSHALPGATTEQVLEAALDLLLEKQARAKALVRRPSAAPTPTSTPTASPAPPATTGRPHVPASIEREVRLRDGDRCQYPLDAGGVCGSTWQVGLDHVVPLALGGETTVANLRCCCAPHNRRSAEELLGQRARARRRASPSAHPSRLVR